MRLNPQIRLQSRPARLPAGFSMDPLRSLRAKCAELQPGSSVEHWMAGMYRKALQRVGRWISLGLPLCVSPGCEAGKHGATQDDFADGHSQVLLFVHSDSDCYDRRNCVDGE